MCLQARSQEKGGPWGSCMAAGALSAIARSYCPGAKRAVRSRLHVALSERLVVASFKFRVCLDKARVLTLTWQPAGSPRPCDFSQASTSKRVASATSLDQLAELLGQLRASAHFADSGLGSPGLRQGGLAANGVQGYYAALSRPELSPARSLLKHLQTSKSTSPASSARAEGLAQKPQRPSPPHAEDAV